MSKKEYEDIGAYYQCYNRQKATQVVLENYRNNYPNGNLVLVCDGGLDFSREAEKYNCHYFYENKVGTEKSSLVFNTTDSLKTWIMRMQKYINLINEKYFILLEDDVIVYRRVNTKTLKFDINGCNYSVLLPRTLVQYLSRYNRRINQNDEIFYGASGGCILRTDFYKYIFENFNLNDEITDYYNNCSGIMASDVFLSYLCYKYNGVIGQYPGFCETWHKNYNRRKKGIGDKIEVLHQFKEFY